MTKTLTACFLVCCFLSCTFTTTNTGQVFVNQELIESNIQSVQPAERIDFAVQTTNDRDSVLIVKLTVNHKIPDDSLNGDKAKQVLYSFLTILPRQSLESFSSCKIIFIKKEGAVVTHSKSISYICPITADITTHVANYKDSARVTIGYIDTSWAYINKDLNISLPLKGNWYYASEEQGSFVYYSLGSDVNQLPQYRTDSDRKVTFRTLRNLKPGEGYPVLHLTKSNLPVSLTKREMNDYKGPSIFAALDMSPFDSEDEYMKNLFELYFSKKLRQEDIHSYHFGNVVFRGHLFGHADNNGQMIYYLSAIKRFRKVCFALNLQYSNAKELEDIKQTLSGMKVNE